MRLNYKLGSNEVFLTSDPHFFHANIIKYCDRPFANVAEMNDALVNNWNSKVPPHGLVFVVGDFCMNATPNSIIELRKRLNGRIILIEGNHDDFVINVNKRHKLFEAIYTRCDIRLEYAEDDASNYIDIELNHFPSLVWNNSHKGAYQAFGHCHSKAPISGQSVFQHEVSVDRNNYTPLSVDEFCVIIAKQRLEGF